MSRKILLLDADDLRKRYYSYQRFSQMANDLGVSINTVLRRIRKMGLPTGRIRSRIPRDELRELYLAGESLHALARRYKCQRIVIIQILKDLGIDIRDNATANRLMMSKRSAEENFKNAQAAHMAMKARPKSEEFLRKKAIGVEQVGRAFSRGEKLLAQELAGKGLKFTIQKAVGCYNIDIALHEFPIAVELFGGAWHASGRHSTRFRKRFDYLIDSGWIPVIVWGQRGRKDNFVGAAEYILSLVERLRRGESVIRQEHVIRGNGTPCAAGKSKLEYRAAIGGDKCGDIIRGKDGRFTYDTIGMCG